jgi:signal transduction histidine kinase/CheY-like chemotaxis protein
MPARRIKFLKQLSWMCLVAFVPYTLIWIIRGNQTLVLLGFLSASPLILNIFLIRQRKIPALAFNIICFSLINVFLYDDGIGGRNGFYYYFFSTLIGIFLLFEPGEKKYRIASVILFLLTLILTNIEGASPRLYHYFPGAYDGRVQLSTVNFLMSILLTFGQGFLMIKAVYLAEKSLKNALSKAQELSELKSQFLSNMSHELRTPMNAVVGISSLLLRENPREDQRKNLEVLRFSSGHLLHIINDILDYSRIEAGKIELENTSFHLPQLLETLRASLTPLAEEKKIDLLFDIDKSIPDFVKGDSNRLTQILNNLLNNALKFTQKGWVRLQVICISNDGVHAKIKFSVKDTGIGIDPEKQNLIFERFSQASSETTRKYGGTGLGLAICRKIAHLHGSEIELKSSPGEGSEFFFTICYLLEKSVEPAAGLTEEGVLSGKKILLAEDNAINQLVARNVLEQWGVELKVVENGRQAVEHLEFNRVDLILMDLQMPEMDGYQASRLIRQMKNGLYASLPIIALTASSQYEVSEQYRRSGMNDFLNKPFNPEELYRKMAGCLLAQQT